MAESTTFTGNISSTRTTYQTLTSKDAFETSVQWACFNKTPFTKAVGVEAFGVAAMKDLQAFGVAQPTGRIIEMKSGVYGVRGPIFSTSGSATHVGRMGSFNPELVEGGDEYAYSWHRLIASTYIPDVDVQDNGKGLIDIKLQKQAGMKQEFVQAFNYALLGNSNGPNDGVLGPSAVYSDLPNLISVTQSRSVGGITKAASGAWGNGTKEVLSIGGGGEMDRPLVLRRSMQDAMNDQAKHAEASKDYLLLATQGAYQYYDRLGYADNIQSGRGIGVLEKYDALGIDHFAFSKQPLIWDAAVTLPYGATASTEAIYGIHIPSYKVNIRSEENFIFDGWEAPRVHDQYRTLNAQIRLRYTPMVTAMRPHFVLYNLPACGD